MKRYIWIYVLASIFVLIWVVRALTHDTVTTQTVRAVEYENKIESEGFVVRNEVVYYTEHAGMAEAVYQNDERVSKGKRIATVYTDGIPEQTRQALDAVNAKIHRLENRTNGTASVGVDLVSAEKKIDDAVATVVEMTQTGNFDELDLVQTEIGGYVQVTAGDTYVNPAEEALDGLYAQKAAIEKTVQSAKVDVYSSIAGVFVSETDGYEQTLTPTNIENMSVSDFEAIEIEREATVPDTLNAGDRVCKVVDNSAWYYSTVVKADYISETEVGDRVWLRFPDISNDRISAKVVHISPVEDGKAVVMISCGEYVQGIYSRRKASCDIVTRVYDGYQLPQAAVRVDESGNTGVYVNVSGIVHFRNIRILYQTDASVIVAKSDENGYLKQYDAVIIGGKNIAEGAVVE